MTAVDVAADRIAKPRGRRRHYNATDVVQMLADGYGLQPIASFYGIRLSSLGRTMRQLKAEQKVKTSPQLVAHYLRNGWID